jgi:predicted DNA binding CopG/RHH family protein
MAVNLTTPSTSTSTRYPRLRYFFNAYFRQNWNTNHTWKGRTPSFEVVVRDFRDEEPKTIVAQATLDLEQIVTQRLSEIELHHLVNKQLRAGVNPSMLGMTYQTWLEAVLAILREHD